MIRYVLGLFIALWVGVYISNHIELTDTREKLSTLSNKNTALVLANENLAAELIEQQQQAERATLALVSRANDLAVINSQLQGRLAQLKALKGAADVKAFISMPLPSCLARLLNNPDNTDTAPGLPSADCPPIDTRPANGPDPIH